MGRDPELIGEAAGAFAVDGGEAWEALTGAVGEACAVGWAGLLGDACAVDT